MQYAVLSTVLVASYKIKGVDVIANASVDYVIVIPYETNDVSVINSIRARKKHSTFPLLPKGAANS